MAKKRKAPAPTDASTDATASSSTADAAPTESVDDIFAALKKKTPAEKRPKAEKPTKKAKRDAAADKAEDEKWRAGRPPTPPGRQENPQVHRYAADGLPVYKYFHLGMDQQDGGTPLCPFDCDCCF